MCHKKFRLNSYKIQYCQYYHKIPPVTGTSTQYALSVRGIVLR
jgi:hypothetical protein